MTMFSQSTASMPTRVSVPGYNSGILANFNIDAAVVLLPFVAGFVLFVLWKIKKEKVWKIRAFKANKEWAFSILLFVQVHLFTSVIISVKYGTNQIFGVGLGAALGGLLVI